MERLYGIEHGATSFQGNQYKEAKPKNSVLHTKKQEDLARENNMSVDTYQNYKTLADMVPELSDLVDTGIVTKSTALAIMKQLSESEFGGCTSTTSLLFRELQLRKSIDQFMKNKQKGIYHCLVEIKNRLWRIRQTRF